MLTPSCSPCCRCAPDAIEVYFPPTCIDEKDLESFDGVPAGKVSLLPFLFSISLSTHSPLYHQQQ